MATRSQFLASHETALALRGCKTCTLWRVRVCWDTLDEKAQAIVNAAQADTPSKTERGKNVVWSILRTYYPDREALIEDHQKRYENEYDKVLKMKEALEAKKKKKAPAAH